MDKISREHAKNPRLRIREKIEKKYRNNARFSGEKWIFSKQPSQTETKTKISRSKMCYSFHFCLCFLFQFFQKDCQNLANFFLLKLLKKNFPRKKSSAIFIFVSSFKFFSLNFSKKKSFLKRKEIFSFENFKEKNLKEKRRINVVTSILEVKKIF